MSIEQNVAARKCAQEVGKFIEWESKEFADEGARRIYFEQLLHEVGSRCPEVLPKIETTTLGPMTDDEVNAFKYSRMPFGKFAGKEVGEVPLEYLAWLADQPGDFKEMVRRFLKNPAVQRQHKTEADCEF